MARKIHHEKLIEYSGASFGGIWAYNVIENRNSVNNKSIIEGPEEEKEPLNGQIN